MIWLIPIIGIVALIVAGGLAMWVTKRDEGTERMREIAAAIHEGAQAFLMAEYKILIIFIVILFAAIGLGISWATAVCFLIGALFSTAAGYRGPVLLLRGTEDALVSEADCKKYMDVYGESCTFVPIEGGNHNFSSIPARRACEKAILDFVLGDTE